MADQLDVPAELKFTGEPLEPPRDWDGAAQFATLRDALQAAVGRMDEAPWIRSAGRTLKPADIDDLWKEAFRPLSD